VSQDRLKAQALFATDAFYLAFANKDAAAMNELWAKEASVCCIHPGWPRLTDRDEIMESWQNILGNPDQRGPTPYDMTATSWGNTVGVTCYEAMSNGVILASKVFVIEAGECRLVLHHGSPCQNPPPPPEQGELLQ